jgi:hypothetical protein
MMASTGVSCDFARVIPFRKDADHVFRFVPDRQGADILFAHQFEGLENGGRGRDRPDLLIMGRDDVAGGLHISPPRGCG